MSVHTTIDGRKIPKLRVVHAPDDMPTQRQDSELEEQLEKTAELTEVEEFWAGRNLADRNSTRKAA
ncbi:MAG: hypothetical protein ACWGMZ_07650 [Thermoguttaceae bacterium]